MFQSFSFLNYEEISEVLKEKKRLGKANEGFCAAVSLNDGEYRSTLNPLYFLYILHCKCAQDTELLILSLT